MVMSFRLLQKFYHVLEYQVDQQSRNQDDCEEVNDGNLNLVGADVQNCDSLQGTLILIFCIIITNSWVACNVENGCDYINTGNTQEEHGYLPEELDVQGGIVATELSHLFLVDLVGKLNPLEDWRIFTGFLLVI